MKLLKPHLGSSPKQLANDTTICACPQLCIWIEVVDLPQIWILHSQPYMHSWQWELRGQWLSLAPRPHKVKYTHCNPLGLCTHVAVLFTHCLPSYCLYTLNVSKLGCNHHKSCFLAIARFFIKAAMKYHVDLQSMYIEVTQKGRGAPFTRPQNHCQRSTCS